MHYNIFMTKVKEPSVAGTFYPADSEALKKQIEEFKNNNHVDYEYKTRAIIVPHAGLIYSGLVAYQGINQLDRNIKTIFIFAPAHRAAFGGLALSSYDEWRLPFKNIKINQDINKELNGQFGAEFNDEAFSLEHSVEIQIPLIQSIFEDIDIVPILVGAQVPEIISDIIEKYYQNPDFGFIISSDLSHFLTDAEAQKLDLKTALMIESGNIEGFSYNQACGAIGICGLVDFAAKNKYSLIRVNMMNSSFVSNDKNRVVGYGSWILYEGTKNEFLKKYYSKYMLTLARKVILSKFDNSKIYTNHMPVFNELGACFVTLKKNDCLRGCIGSIIAHQSLINDLVQNAQKSAFSDPRFEPVEKDEVKDLTINISILSSPKKIDFKDENDLLDKIVPYQDGLIIKDGYNQAVYLPSVWEELSEKEMFLKSLKIKAGLHPDHFSPNFEAYRFYAQYIEEN